MTLRTLFQIYLLKLYMLMMQKLEEKSNQCRIGREIKSMQDCVDRWSDIWKLFFNGTKCKVLTIARSFKHNFQYHLNNIQLESVKEFNDLGLLINSSLTWINHIATKISKAKHQAKHSMLGRIKRTVGFNAPYRVKLHLYTTLVKPLFSYASIVYSCSKADLNQIERIQREATKYILNDYVSDYPTRLPNYFLCLL